MQLQDTTKMYPCWRTYQEGEKLPAVSFRNGRIIDLSSSEVKIQLEKMPADQMLMFYEHLYYGQYQPCNGKTEYLFGQNFSVLKNDDDSVCVFGNGCSFQ